MSHNIPVATSNAKIRIQQTSSHILVIVYFPSKTVYLHSTMFTFIITNN